MRVNGKPKKVPMIPNLAPRCLNLVIKDNSEVMFIENVDIEWDQVNECIAESMSNISQLRAPSITFVCIF